MMCKISLVLALLLALVAILAGFWPGAVLAIILLVLCGRSPWAVGLGLFFDLLWGPPAGALSFVILPFTAGVVALALLRAALMRFMRPRIPREL